MKNLVQISAIGADQHSCAAYARTKAAGEVAVRAAFPDASVIRPSIVFGSGDSFFNLFASLMWMTPVLPVIGCSLPRVEFPSPGKGGGLPRLNIYGDGGPRFSQFTWMTWRRPSVNAWTLRNAAARRSNWADRTCAASRN